MEVNIAQEFTKKPGLRTEEQTPGTSGMKFRDEILIRSFDECLKRGEKLRILMDGTNGFSPSFLEEAFGGLARLKGADLVLGTLEIIAIEQPYLKDDIIGYVMRVKQKEDGENSSLL